MKILSMFFVLFVGSTMLMLHLLMMRPQCLMFQVNEFHYVKALLSGQVEGSDIPLGGWGGQGIPKEPEPVSSGAPRFVSGGIQVACAIRLLFCVVP